jgi:threonine/homoserine/homoserine lactone efflux protein
VVSDLATRYGTSHPARRRMLVAGVAVLVVAFLGWVVWVIAVSARPAVQSELVSFDVVDEHTATATFTVVREEPQLPASCLLRAQAPDHSVVGELDVAVSPGDSSVATLTEAVRTERMATSVSMVGCVTEGQERRR